MKLRVVTIVLLCLAASCGSPDEGSDSSASISSSESAAGPALEVNLTTEAGAGSLKFQIPENWTATEDVIDGLDEAYEDIEDPDTDTWRIARNANDDVEKELAKQFGLEDKLPLYDPSGVMEEDELDALTSNEAKDLGHVRIVAGTPPGMEVGGPPAAWTTTEEVKTYLDRWHKNEDHEPVELAGFSGFTYTSDIFLESQIYQLIHEPGQRLFISIYPASSNHRAEIDAILGSIQPPK